MAVSREEHSRDSEQLLGVLGLLEESQVPIKKLSEN